MLYNCYGLRIESEIALPELIELEALNTALPNVDISLGDVSECGIESGIQLGPNLWVTDTSLWLQVPFVARFLVSNGNQIVIDPAPSADEASVRVFLLGSGLGALMLQRGYLVFHGAAVRIGNHSMLCVGKSGAGKSTLAAGFIRRGYNILADDVVPIDSTGCAIPGIPSVKLWRDAANQMGIETSKLRRTRPNMEKFRYPARHNFADTPLPVKWIYVLNRHSKHQIEFSAIRGLERFTQLRANIYRHQFMEALKHKADLICNCAAIAGRVHMSRVNRPTHSFELEGLIDAILLDIKDHS